MSRGQLRVASLGNSSNGDFREGETTVTGSNTLAELQSRISEKTARVGVVGLGYVGLPLALGFARNGFRTTGFDIDPAKVERLGRGETYIGHIPGSVIADEVRKGLFAATADYAGLREMDAIIICVPTPLNEHRDPDLSYIQNTAEAIGARLRPGQLIVLESTTYPGTTDEVVLPILERSGLRCPPSPYATNGSTVTSAEAVGGDFLLAFSPEREDPGNKQFQTHQIPKVIGGVNAASAQAARDLYQQVFEKAILVSSARAAEMTKLLENIYRCVNIALVNELKLLCLRMGIDIWEVIEAARTKPFGFTPFYPGPGLGGHCIPIDPFYLTWKAREYEFPTRFIELAGEINSAMPEHVVASLADALNHRRQCLQEARILVLGVAYKKDIDDLRESPSLRIMELLRIRGARVDYHDPYFPNLPKMRRYDFRLASVELTAQVLSQFDAIVIATDHSSYDYHFIARHARLVLDTRNATRDLAEFREKIVRC
jgi:UDP-N-acetyl-D-glucosamine dehydrogenase